VATTTDAIHLDLPDGAEPVPSGDTTDAGVIDQRRWLCPGGLYVHLAVTEAGGTPESDPRALDRSVGLTLGRYWKHFRGRFGTAAPVPVAGAVAARGASGRLRSSAGEPLHLALVAAQTEDRRIVTVQVTWPRGIDRHDTAVAVLTSLALLWPQSG
jgi:hypothetical protein